MDEYHYARIAYDAYCEDRNWKSVRGEPLPQFDDQADALKKAWNAAADSVIAAVKSQFTITKTP